MEKMCFLVAGVGVYPFLAVFFSFSVSIFVQRLRMLDRHRSYNFHHGTFSSLLALVSAPCLQHGRSVGWLLMMRKNRPRGD